jgi:AcrR family transcriptional regulator
MSASDPRLPDTAAVPPRATARRTGRRPGSSGSREAILRAARLKFSEYGYERTTVRAIAREAQVDTALIHHFFGSKEGVFAAAAQEALRPRELMPLLAGELDTIGERLLSTFLELWESAEQREPLIAVIRSAVSHETAATILREFVSTEVLGPLAEALNTSRPGLRSTLVGSQLVGLIMVRYIVRVEPLASLDRSTLIAVYAPVLQGYLTGDLDLPAAGS